MLVRITMLVELSDRKDIALSSAIHKENAILFYLCQTPEDGLNGTIIQTKKVEDIEEVK